MANRTAWHVVFAALLRQRAPHRFEVRAEVPLSSEPLRADYLLLRTADRADDAPAGTLKHLWEHLAKDAIVELKSVSRPYRARNLCRLWAYLHLYYADEPGRLPVLADLAGVLVVPSRTAPLDADASALGLTWQDLGAGYWALAGGPFALFVAEIDTVAEAEDDDLLRLFGHGRPHTLHARRWFREYVDTEETAMELHELPDYDEFLLKLVAQLPPEKVIGSYAPEERLAGLPPEQRLAGLPPEQAVLALPDEVLRGLSAEYLATLPDDVRAAIRARIGG